MSAGYVPCHAQILTPESCLRVNDGAISVKLGLLRDVSASSFVGALEEGICDNTSQSQAKTIAGELRTIISVMHQIGDVHRGDIVHFTFSQTHGISVELNGRIVGERLGGRPLFDAVLWIWLDEKTIDDELKKALLTR